MHLLGLPYKELTEEDLKKILIDAKASESETLDFKLQVDSDNYELVKDIACFANKRGGFILYGVKEEDGIAKELVGIDNVDDESLKVVSIATSCITEHILGFDLHSIPLSNGKSILIVNIPHDFKGPHMIHRQHKEEF